MPTVTSHVYPKGLATALAAGISLTSATPSAYKMGLLTTAAATWGATQEGYNFVSDVTGAYTEVSSSGYARVALTTVALTESSNTMKWSCASPISFGSSITLSALSGFIYTTLTGSGDSTYPVLAIIDFNATVASTAGAWTYTVDPTNGLALFTSS